MKSTSDIWFSIFLVNSKHRVETFEKNSKNMGVWFFDVSEDDWKKYKLEFDRSELKTIKSIHGSLKDLLY